MEELGEEPCPARVRRVGDARQSLDDPRVVARDRVARQQTARVHGGGLDADQTHPAVGAGGVVGHEVVGR